MAELRAALAARGDAAEATQAAEQIALQAAALDGLEYLLRAKDVAVVAVLAAARDVGVGVAAAVGEAVGVDAAAHGDLNGIAGLAWTSPAAAAAERWYQWQSFEMRCEV